MATKSLNTPHMIVIVGETASGKSALAMNIAQKCNGEIICADSRTIYRYLDISTAKPSISDQKEVPHHLINILDPDHKYNVSMFKHDSTQAIYEISKRGKLPVMVGGSGLYIDSVLYDYKFGEYNDRNSLREKTLVLGIKLERDIIKKRIRDRVEAMFDEGLINEIQNVTNEFGWDIEAMKSKGYKAVRDYLNGNISIDAAKAALIKSDLDLAKKQRTWFKRNKSIHWVDNPSKALDFVQQFLNK